MKVLQVLSIHLLFTLVTYAQEERKYIKIDSLDHLLEISDKLTYENNMYDALDFAFKATQYAQELDHTYYLALSHFKMGNIQYEIMDFENSKKQYLKALEYCEKVNFTELHSYILQSLANIIYEDEQDYKTALVYYKKGIDLGRGTVSPNNSILPLTNVVWTQMDLGQYKEATPYLKEIDRLFNNLKDSIKDVKSSVYLLKARNEMHLGNQAKSEEYFAKVLEILQTEESYWQKGFSYLYKYRAEMHERFGNHEKANADLKNYVDSEYKIFKNSRIKNNEITKIRFEVDRYQEELKAANREKELIAKNNRYIIYFSFLGILLLGSAVYFYYRAYKSKKKSNEILELKNKELKIAKEKEEKLNKTKSQFISTVSHELRTPLYGIIGISSIFSENKDHSENDQKLLKSLKFSADYLLNLVNKVLTISKIDSEKVTITLSPTQLQPLTQNILDSFEYRAQVKGLELKFDYDAAIPEVVMIDSLGISEILINLIGNALKFTNEGCISLQVQLLQKDKDHATLRFEVIDTGVGIPEDQKEQIFEEFSQVGNLYDNTQGTGLGLSIVKNLLSLMNSKILCKSEHGSGSTFYFDLSLEISEQVVEETETQLPATPKPITAASILLVEDNKINQLVTKNLLKNIGYPCEVAENGLKAVEMMKANSYDLVLMDLNMPIMAGIPATIEIRTFDTITPIIALTASELSEVSDECLQSGMNDLLNKPLNMDSLKISIEKNLAK